VRLAHEFVRGDIEISLPPRRLPIRSPAEFDKPVTFASGRAKLVMSLLSRGSGTKAKTTGMVAVASLAYGGR